jgi:hypothetical protein
MAGIGAPGGKTACHRDRRIEPRVAQRIEASDEHAVESGAAILHGLAVPLLRQVDLEMDQQSCRIKRRNLAQHLAVRDARLRRGRRRRQALYSSRGDARRSARNADQSRLDAPPRERRARRDPLRKHHGRARPDGDGHKGGRGDCSNHAGKAEPPTIRNSAHRAYPVDGCIAFGREDIEVGNPADRPGASRMTPSRVRQSR